MSSVAGWASQFRAGGWTAIAAEAVARSEAARLGNLVVPGMPVQLTFTPPPAPPRPSVALATDGIIVTYNTQTARWIATYPSTAAPTFVDVVTLIRNVPVLDTEIDAVQALPALTAAWEAA